MSTELEITAPVAQDVAENVTLVARTPAEMREAQSSLSQWFAAKVEICRKDHLELEQSLAIATEHGIPTASLQRQANAMAKRVNFYQKCKAAVDAGYCIVPNFPVDVFAIRTARVRPDRNESRYVESAQKDQVAQALPVGEGRYVDPEPVVYGKSITERDTKGELVPATRYYADHFGEEIDFPISISKPQVLQATAMAMAEKIFDEIGISPARQVKKQDPIIVGRIIDPRGSAWNPRRVSFLLAWWINTADL